MFASKQNGENHAPWLGNVKGDYVYVSTNECGLKYCAFLLRIISCQTCLPYTVLPMAHACRYHPIGDTDSEAVFCALLNALRAKFTTLPSLPVLHETLGSLCREIVTHDEEETILNFLLTCGPHVQWVYSWPGARPGSNVWNGLHYTVREPPFQKCTLRDLDVHIDFSQVTSPDDRVAVIATKPLTQNEEWIEMKRGELILFDEGIPHTAAHECIECEEKGHGLQSTAIPRSPQLKQDLRRFQSQAKSEFAGGGI